MSTLGNETSENVGEGVLTRSSAGSAGERPLQVVCIRNMLGDCVAMDSQSFRSFGQVLLVSGEGFFDIEVFEFVDRFGQQDVAV